MADNVRGEPSPVEDDERSLADAHRDINFGNRYRLEYIKHLISVATGVLVFTIAFMKDFVRTDAAHADARFLLLLGWSALVASAVAGIFHMRYWAWYYTSWGTEWTAPRAKEWRTAVDRRRVVAENVQLYGFVAGILCLLIFAGWNLLARPHAAATEHRAGPTRSNTTD
jgi:hypothetical protein